MNLLAAFKAPRKRTTMSIIGEPYSFTQKTPYYALLNFPH